jgi:phosphotransferase system HPr-like phosphotransfer protein
MLTKALKDSDTLFQKIKTPAEAAIEAQSMSNLAAISVQQARRLRLDNDGFDAQDWLGKVALVLGIGDRNLAQTHDNDDDDDDDLDRPSAESRTAEGWLRIGAMAMRHSLRAPAIDFMRAAPLCERVRALT